MPQGERRTSRSRSRQNGGRHDASDLSPKLEQQLCQFRKRYPADSRAFEFLKKSHANVIEQVLSDFQPPHENQDDYSALLTNFVRQVRERLRGPPSRPRKPPHDSSSQALPDRDHIPHGQRKHDRRSLRELVVEVGSRLGRKPQDVEPLVGLLESNWYDTADSLAGLAAQDLAAVGVPLRFAKELVDVVEFGRSVRPASARVSSTKEARGAHGGKDRTSEKGKGKSNKSGGKGNNEERARNGELLHKISVQVGDLRLEDIKALAGRIRGEHGKHFKYIRNRSKAEVLLAGTGSGHVQSDTREESREPLHVQIRCDDRANLDRAVELITDLLNNVVRDFKRRR